MSWWAIVQALRGLVRGRQEGRGEGSFWWNLAYLGRPPWDSGTVPPELRTLIEVEKLPPGRAVDLGCGTGTCTLYLAQHGFQVTGIDMASRAIARARRKLGRAGVEARLLVGDVTRLGEPGGPSVPVPLDLALDQGCFHSLPEERRAAYVHGLAGALRSGGTYLLFAFQPRGQGGPPVGPRGLTQDQVLEIVGPDFQLLEAQTGVHTRPGTWYRCQRR